MRGSVAVAPPGLGSQRAPAAAGSGTYLLFPVPGHWFAGGFFPRDHLPSRSSCSEPAGLPTPVGKAAAVRGPNRRTAAAGHLEETGRSLACAAVTLRTLGPGAACRSGRNRQQTLDCPPRTASRSDHRIDQPGRAHTWDRRPVPLGAGAPRAPGVHASGRPLGTGSVIRPFSAFVPASACPRYRLPSCGLAGRFR